MGDGKKEGKRKTFDAGKKERERKKKIKKKRKLETGERERVN